MPIDPQAPRPLHERLGYDEALEATGLEALGALDVSGCRRILGRLVHGLDPVRAAGSDRLVVQLLADLLQRVNARLHGHPGMEQAYRLNRLAIIEQIASSADAATACERFLPYLNRLLAPLEQGPPPVHPIVERSRSHIDLNYRRRLSLSAVANSLGVSANYLSRLFRRETGMTLTAYIQRTRLDHAMLLLADRSQSLSEIAYRVGYQNYRDFYRNLVKYERVSPRQVRRRMVAETRGERGAVPLRPARTDGPVS